jgi:hypothetical protein
MPIRDYFNVVEKKDDSEEIDYELFTITSPKKKEFEYTIEFKNPYNEEIIIIKIDHKEELYKVVNEISEKFEELEEIRFYHKGYVIKLEEKIETIFEIEDEVRVYINGKKYVLDWNDKYTRDAIVSYNNKNYKVAIKKYTESLRRYPNRIKNICNR